MDEERDLDQAAAWGLLDRRPPGSAYDQLWADIREAYEYVCRRRVIAVEAPGFKVYRAPGPDIAIVVYGAERS